MPSPTRGQGGLEMSEEMVSLARRRRAAARPAGTEPGRHRQDQASDRRDHARRTDRVVKAQPKRAVARSCRYLT